MAFSSILSNFVVFFNLKSKESKNKKNAEVFSIFIYKKYTLTWFP